MMPVSEEGRVLIIICLKVRSLYPVRECCGEGGGGGGCWLSGYLCEGEVHMANEGRANYLC